MNHRLNSPEERIRLQRLRNARKAAKRRAKAVERDMYELARYPGIATLIQMMDPMADPPPNVLSPNHRIRREAMARLIAAYESLRHDRSEPVRSVVECYTFEKEIKVATRERVAVEGRWVSRKRKQFKLC